MSALDKAFDEWRGVPFSPGNPVGTILNERELALTRQAFAGGLRAAAGIVDEVGRQFDADIAIVAAEVEIRRIADGA